MAGAAVLPKQQDDVLTLREEQIKTQSAERWFGCSITSSGDSLLQHCSASRLLVVDKGFMPSPYEVTFLCSSCSLALDQTDAWDKRAVVSSAGNACISSRFDYCSSLRMVRLFASQNWFPVEFRTHLKILVATSKAWKNLSPASIFDLISPLRNNCSLKSLDSFEDQKFLQGSGSKTLEPSLRLPETCSVSFYI